MAIESIANQALSDSNALEQRDQKLKKACQDFESVFTYQLLRSMRATIDKSGLMDGGQGEEVYESLLDQELAKSMLEWSPNGLANALYQQLKKTQDPGDEKLPLRPLQGDISSGFGSRKDPFTGEDQFHYGVDLAAGLDTPIKASLAGRVLVSAYQEGYGNLVLLDHGKGFTTLYAHNRENEVQEGQWVEKGESIGRVGMSGSTTGPHLHFEVRKNGQYLNPLNFLRGENALF